MPTYQYACTECRKPLEVVQSFSDDPLTECPSCGGRLRKVFSPVGVVFKGSGFYKTDSRRSEKSGAGSGSSTGSSSENGSSDSGSSDSGSKKSEIAAGAGSTSDKGSGGDKKDSVGAGAAGSGSSSKPVERATGAPSTAKSA